MDGWIDIYVSNDRQVAANAMYLNNGNGSLTDISVSSGTNIILDAMSNTPGDYDNDGDMDIYESNHDDGNVLFQNNGDLTFNNIAGNVGLTVNEICWAAQWIDQNLDGWNDLYVSTSPLNNNQPDSVIHNFFFRSNSADTFEYRPDSGMESFVTRTYCAAQADFDNNGSPDLVLACKSPFRAELWQNQSAGHRYIKVALVGTVSNRDGVGSVVRCYANGMMQTKTLMFGESHLSQNSQYLLFGIGDSDVVDSLTVTWPSGIVDRFSDVESNQTINVEEGITLISVSIAENRTLPFLISDGTLSITDNSVNAIQISDLIGRETRAAHGHSINLTPGPYVVRWRFDEGTSHCAKIMVE